MISSIPRSFSAGITSWVSVVPCSAAAPARLRDGLELVLGGMPSGVSSLSCAATCWRRPATRTWKNSSRLDAKMERNFTRSSSGVRGSQRLVEHPAVELEPGQLAIDVERRSLEIGRLVDGGARRSSVMDSDTRLRSTGAEELFGHGLKIRAPGRCMGHRLLVTVRRDEFETISTDIPLGGIARRPRLEVLIHPVEHGAPPEPAVPGLRTQCPSSGK